MIASHELPHRRPVWEALSELFLDTELSPDEVARVSEVLARSPYDLDQLQRILYDELLPPLWLNGHVPAGIWEAFDQEALEAAILRRARRRLRWPAWALPRGVVRKAWADMRLRVATARRSSAGPC